jgi:hypothetical protein
METELQVALNMDRTCAIRLLKTWYFSVGFWIVLVFALSKFPTLAQRRSLPAPSHRAQWHIFCTTINTCSAPHSIPYLKLGNLFLRHPENRLSQRANRGRPIEIPWSSLRRAGANRYVLTWSVRSSLGGPNRAGIKPPVQTRHTLGSPPCQPSPPHLRRGPFHLFLIRSTRFLLPGDSPIFAVSGHNPACFRPTPVRHEVYTPSPPLIPSRSCLISRISIDFCGCVCG